MSQAPQHSTAHHSPQAAHRGTASSPKSHVTKCESGRSVSPKPHSPRISTEEYLRIKDKIRRAADVGADELKKIPSADLKRFYRNAVACRNRDSVNPKKTEIIAYIINNKTEVFENDYKSKREAAAAEGKRAEAMKLNQEELNRYYNEFEKRNFSAAARLPKYQLNQLLFSVGMRNYSTVKKDELPQWVRENWLPRHPPHYSEKVRSPDTSKAREAAKLARDLRLRGQTYQKATIMKQTSPSSRREPKSKYSTAATYQQLKKKNKNFLNGDLINFLEENGQHIPEKTHNLLLLKQAREFVEANREHLDARYGSSS